MLTGWRGKGENNGFSKMDIIRGLVKTSFCAVIENNVQLENIQVGEKRLKRESKISKH